MNDSTLRIGGYTPLTTIDYPGELAAVIFCQGCPWRCAYCQNDHLLDARAETPFRWDEIRRHLEQRRGLLDAVVLSGGEPTAQSASLNAATDLKAMGFKIGLHTGGAYPDRLKHLLPLCDWVGFDLKELPEHYDLLTVTPGSGSRCRFRTSIWRIRTAMTISKRRCGRSSSNSICCNSSAPWCCRPECAEAIARQL